MVLSIPSQWFKKHRGLATGLVIAGSSFGGAVPSLIVQEMLDRIGFRKTLLIYSFVQGVTMLLGFSLVKVRPFASKAQTPAREIQWFDKKYLRDPRFWSFWVALFFALFGYNSPFVFISVYTAEKIPGISTQLANLPIPIMSFASAIGRTAAGYVADRIGYMNAFILAITISGLSQLILWNVAAETYPGIMVFSIVFGLTGPCFLSLVTPIAASMYGTDNLATLSGLFNIANVPGLLSGPPIGGVILDSAGHDWHALTAYSGGIQILGVISIGQADTPGRRPLPGTETEIEYIRAHTESNAKYSQLLSHKATVTAVLDAMEQHDWVHLACHAHQNLIDPTQSGFFLHGGTLDLAAINRRSFKGKGLAFLSACQTATGDEKLADEAVHLASGMLMAGYTSVIGTMWSVHDEDAPLVADKVYAQLMKDRKLGNGEAGRALHHAVAALRDKVGEQRFERWVPYIHMGS
ncbi:unnamed protein product [Rhizoctonia solani]|uniref:Major facilitator superfamily (MFS) profile domain-containing protein n=1 Tax=Rhizoctonia solani TaxID=456999 RepID=A0A8H3E9F6_9AGAM|nr:unnamed protein product [Rhizoctonia solani]